MAKQARLEPQCENHGRPARKLHHREAAFCNKISVVRRSETEGESQQYGGSRMSDRKVYQWVERFQEGQTSVVDEHRSGRLYTAVSNANVAHVDALIGENRLISVGTVATMLNISVGYAHSFIHETLKYRCVRGGC
jgi:hypothetical protein